MRTFLIQRLREQKSFLIFVLVMLSVRSSLADHYRVPTGSMEPIVEPGDHILVDKAAYGLRVPFTTLQVRSGSEPQRGEVIVFDSPTEPGTNLVKRLIAVPGDSVEILDGFIRINGEWLEGGEAGSAMLTEALARGASGIIHYEERLGGVRYSVRRDLAYVRREHLRFRVPEGKLFFMGDNRDRSSDSRAWGFASREAVKGRAGVAISWNHFQWLGEKRNADR